MDAVTPVEASGWFKTLVETFGPGGAVLAVLLGVALWWIRDQDKECRNERAALVAQIKDSEQKRREDVIAQHAQIGTYVDVMRACTEKIAHTLTEMRIAFAEKGIKS